MGVEVVYQGHTLNEWQSWDGNHVFLMQAVNISCSIYKAVLEVVGFQELLSDGSRKAYSWQ